LATAMADGAILNDFCRIVTKKPDHDFMSDEFGTVCWVLNDFFGALVWSMRNHGGPG
jgi:hypothetical protein